jgi:AcrR family transcriptional regulator
MSERPALREKQAAVVREAILDAVADQLEQLDPDDIALPRVAEEAGVSTRTLYRYFATREELFAAAGDHIVARLGLQTRIGRPEDISAEFLRASATGAQHPQLVRSMLHTSLGRRARSGHRSRRVQGLMAALAEVTSHLDPDEAHRRSAAIAYLCSLAAWVTVSEETGLPAADAQRGVAWALETLVAALRAEHSASQHTARLPAADCQRRAITGEDLP